MSPYLHLSRHLHAMRRPRGCGGRFLNSKPPNSGKNRTDTDKTGNCQTFQPAESQNSEVLQSESVNLNSPSGSMANLLGSEVTSSIFSTGNFNQHAINHLRPSANSVSNMLKWVAADPGHSNLKTCRQGKGGIGVELLAPPRS
ncbi:unnamed protein product [Thlaspi arvense]|uniref:Nuclear transcription factor Y subunit n=1 Tax=Thlaspi arvense TaxID=13288 RepID=A0AAU9S861_THLAR|nr:unnamed protein product [Thlaspi arvense]